MKFVLSNVAARLKSFNFNKVWSEVVRIDS